MAVQRNLSKDFHSLLKTISSFSDGQAAVTQWNDESLERFQVTIAPHGGPYKDGEFVFEITAGPHYPDEAPEVFAKTAIYHPNIDTINDPDGEVCLNILCDWLSQFNLEDVVQGILFLLFNPNLDDALVDMTCEQVEFEQNIKISLMGGKIGRYIFPPNVGYAKLHPNEIGPEATSVESEDEKREEMNEHEETKGATESDDVSRNKRDKEMVIETMYFGIKHINSEMETDYEETDEDEDEDENLAWQRRWHRHGNFRIRQSLCNSSDCEEEDAADDPHNDCSDDASCDVQNMDGDVREFSLDIDGEIVNDEDLEKPFDLPLGIGDYASENTTFEMTATEGENVISWNKMMYGGDNTIRQFQELLNASNTTTLQPLHDVVPQGNPKDSGSAMSRMRITRTPTVMYRYLLALQTRTFRRWML